MGIFEDERSDYMGGLVVRRNEFFKPNMTGLEGEAGMKIIAHLKKSQVESDENVRKKAAEYKRIMLAERKKINQ